MKRKKKRTAEERRADEARYEETTRLLLERIERGPVPRSAQDERRDAS
jgi:hypothetical protein